MREKFLFTIITLTTSIATPLNANAFASSGDGKIITEWEIFRSTVENYKKSINNRENIEYAKEGEKRGKKAFLAGDLQKADYRGYGDSIAWIPRPEYFFIVGDINLRHKVSLHTDSPYSPPEYKTCWDKYLFGLDLNKLESDFDRGFGLVEELNLSGTRNSKIYKQAMTNAMCLLRLTGEYSEGVGPQCVPVEKVKQCLGEPLLFLYH